MPIISIHEEVAIRLAENNNKLDTKEFYLGVCAPDTVNLNGFAEKEKRWTSHQRKKDLNEWRNSLKEFYQKEKNNYPKNFLLGYITHILTDIIYDDYFYNDVKKQIINDNNSNDDPHELMGKDMEYYFNSSKYKNKIKEVLTNQNKFYNILNISSKELELFILKNLNIHYQTKQSHYINDKLLNNLTIKVQKELQEYIENSI